MILLLLLLLLMMMMMYTGTPRHGALAHIVIMMVTMTL